jgi:hypothetical protein
VAVVLLRSEVRDDARSGLEDLVHFLDLIIFLRNLGLIDAHSICPDPVSICESIFVQRSLNVLKGIEEILPDRHFLVFDENNSGIIFRTPRVSWALLIERQKIQEEWQGNEEHQPECHFSNEQLWRF